MEYAQHAYHLVKIAPAQTIALIASQALEKHQLVNAMILTSITMEYAKPANHRVLTAQQQKLALVA